jgi:hypothetical protein
MYAFSKINQSNFDSLDAQLSCLFEEKKLMLLVQYLYCMDQVHFWLVLCKMKIPNK